MAGPGSERCWTNSTSELGTGIQSACSAHHWLCAWPASGVRVTAYTPATPRGARFPVSRDFIVRNAFCYSLVLPTIMLLPSQEDPRKHTPTVKAPCPHRCSVRIAEPQMTRRTYRDTPAEPPA